MTAELLSRARAGDGEAFRELTGPHRRELQVHCYRMLGSFADAEDAVQETMLAAWQGIGGVSEERPPPAPPPTQNALLEGAAGRPAGPEARYEQTEAISLAFVTALQLLPPRQLAVLILRDVLGFHASEVAGIRHATGFYVLPLAGNRICAMTCFEASVLPWFGLPRSLPSR